MDELSIFGKDAEIEAAVKQTTPQDVKTPSDQHVPDSEQPVETQEEYDYNDDVAYLRTYGRA
jgi:enhancing lycopene biosynthesis protein 2